MAPVLKHDAFDGLRGAIVAVAFVFPVETAEAAVEFVGEQIERFVSIVAFDAGNQIGATDFQVALGDELIAGGARVIELDVEADADEVLVVAEEALGDAFRVSAERGGELDMNPANDNFGGQDFGGGENFLVFHHLI